MELQKETNRADWPDKKRYDDACAAAHAMDLFGERWAMPVMRELLLGPRRFSGLKTSLAGISAKVLTERLEGLEAAGILVKRKLPPPASVQVYELTQWGYEAAPIFQAMGRWAVRSPRHDKTKQFSPVSLMLSLRTMFAAPSGQGEGRIQLKMHDQDFFWVREGNDVKIGRGAIDTPDATLTGTPTAIASIVYGNRPLDDAIGAGDLVVEGDRGLIEALPACFPIPDPAPERAA
jgi:DNA-binding HxlR family transcriptional regulator